MKKILASVITLGVAIALTGSAFAANKTPTTKAACAKAHMTWDASAKKCS
jgi:hypothetical protein